MSEIRVSESIKAQVAHTDTPKLARAHPLTPTTTFTPSQTLTPSFTPTPGQPPQGPVTITYEYDPLYRLTEANYSIGDYYHYTYDAVGNRLSQDRMVNNLLAEGVYQYDDANRLIVSDEIPYTWDNNGNLLNDGVNTYTYDSANRLIAFNGMSSYAYNGLGDRLSQTVNGNTTNYTLDLNAGLTQVLNDGTNSYLYGNGRIAQTQGTVTEYFLGDALGSVRQLTDASGDLTLAKSYAPYGEVANSAGSAVSPFAFTGEQQDVSGLTYLRARYYSSGDGRFISRDTWMGNYDRPLSLNRWNYVEGNPVNFTDPTGLIKQNEAADADKIVKELRIYKVFVRVDWGEWSYWYNDPVDASKSGLRCGWNEGEWELNELKEIRKGVVDLARAMGGLNKFMFNLGYVNVYKTPLGADLARGGLHVIKVNNTRHDIGRWATIHELGHSWDANFGWRLSKNFFILTAKYGKVHASVACDPGKKLPGCNNAGYVYVDVLAYGADENMNMREDFANSVAAYVYPEYTQEKIQKYQNPSAQYNYIDYREYLYYTDYRTTLRWRIIDAFIRSTNASRLR